MILVVIIGSLAGALFIIFLHEVGHVLGGVCGGMRPRFVIIGPLHVECDARGWRVRRNRSLALAGGVALAVPTEAQARDVEVVRRAMLRMVVGGPVMSVLVGLLLVACAAAVRHAGDPATTGFDVRSFACATFGALSLALGIGNACSFNNGGFDSDGRRAMRLRRPSPAAYADAAGVAITGLVLAGVRPRDWPAALVARVVAVPDTLTPIQRVLAYQLGAAHAFDTGDADGGCAQLEQALALRGRVPGLVRSGLLAEAAWAAAWHGRDAARARAWLAEAGRGSRVFDGGLGHTVARAAVASREGRSVETRDAVADARRALAAAPALAGSGVQVAAERLAQLEATLAAMPAPVLATLAPVAT